MMYCYDRYYGDLQNSNIQDNGQFNQPDLIFSRCLSSDNTTTLTNLRGCSFRYSLEVGFCRYPSNLERAIFSKDLIDNGWVLSFIEKHDSEDYTYYIFYKVSSD